MAKPNPVVHFEMPTKNRQRTADFYSKVFHWEMIQMPENMGNYLMAHTTETDDAQMPKNPGAINGGFWETQEDASPHIVIAVDNLEESMKMVEENGGKILDSMSGNGQKIDDIPGVGRYCTMTDTEGNKVGLLQPHQM